MLNGGSIMSDLSATSCGSRNSSEGGNMSMIFIILILLCVCGGGGSGGFLGGLFGNN